MNKELKDYLHLYLGCVGEFTPPDGISYYSPDKLTPEVIHKVFYNGYSFKPILRPLSSMTEEEKFEYHVLDGKFSSDNVLPEIRAGRLTNFFLSRKSVEATRFLLSKHFDLFGLIPAELAIDATTLK